MAVKIKDVAEKAGVSVTTVSRFLNGGKHVSQESKVAIQSAIDELQYSPSYIARSLVLQKTNLIGVIVPDLSSSFFSTILCSIEQTASLNNYSLMVCNIAEDTGKELKYLDLFNQMRVDGIIVMHEKTNDKIRKFINSIKVPVIFCSCKCLNINAASIGINDFKAAYEATEYLINLGHSKIAFIGGDMIDISSGQNRHKGYKKAMDNNKILIINDYIKFGNYKMKSGYNLMKEVLDGNTIPTAVFAASDDMAIGALNCITDFNLKVPDDISLVGFDGSALTDIVRPRLTTIQQPIAEMGELAVNMLVNQKNSANSKLDELILKHKLIERESCKKCDSL